MQAIISASGYLMTQATRFQTAFAGDLAWNPQVEPAGSGDKSPRMQIAIPRWRNELSVDETLLLAFHILGAPMKRFGRNQLSLIYF